MNCIRHSRISLRLLFRCRFIQCCPRLWNANQYQFSSIQTLIEARKHLHWAVSPKCIISCKSSELRKIFRISIRNSADLGPTLNWLKRYFPSLTVPLSSSSTPFVLQIRIPFWEPPLFSRARPRTCSQSRSGFPLPWFVDIPVRAVLPFTSLSGEGRVVTINSHTIRITSTECRNSHICFARGG